MSIRARLLLLTLGLVIPLMMVGLYNQWDTWTASRLLLDSSIEQQAKLAATAFETSFRMFIVIPLVRLLCRYRCIDHASKTIIRKIMNLYS